MEAVDNRSKIFELDQAFKDKYREVQNKIDDENL